MPALPPPGPDCPIVIVGAGVAGAATAWHLRRLGAGPVLLLEAEEQVGLHASGRNAAIVRTHPEVPFLQPYFEEGLDQLRVLPDDIYKPCGGLLIGPGSARADAYHADVRGTGTWHPRAGTVDGGRLLDLLLRDLPVRTRCRVETWSSHDGGLALETNQGCVQAHTLVLATGAWAGGMGALPLEPLNRHLFVTAVDPAIDQEGPWVWDERADYYVRPYRGAWMLCVCDETPAAPGSQPVDPAVASRLAARLRAHQPALAMQEVAHAWVGQRTFAPDRLPVVGFDPRTPRLFHVGALGGYGITLCLSIGRMAAEVITGRAEVPPELRPDRLLPARTTT
jgi:D-arginine dehydrogenase